MENFVDAPKVTVSPGPLYEVEQGETATLRCEAKANPPPTRYLWTLSNSRSTKSWIQNTVTMQATVNDRGNYTCTVSNNIGQGQDVARLEVFSEPEINLEKTQVFQEGQKMVLECPAEGFVFF